MRWLIAILTLLLFSGLPDQSWSAECYEGIWEVDTKTDRKTLEIKADGCLELTVSPKDKQSKEVFYETCYKIKDKKQQVYVFEIDLKGEISTAEIVCSGGGVELKWGEFSNHTYRPVKK